jgi:hypothetical protein
MYIQEERKEGGKKKKIQSVARYFQNLHPLYFIKVTMNVSNKNFHFRELPENLGKKCKRIFSSDQNGRDLFSFFSNRKI